MRRISDAIDHLLLMDMESRQKGVLQSLHPLSKLLVTIVYIALVVSFGKYNLQGVLIMGVYPIIMSTVGNIPVRHLFRRMRLLLLLVFFIGILNPFFDKSPAFTVGSFQVTGGMVSMLSLITKGVYCLFAGYILMVTTSMDDICRALRKVHVPEIIVTVIMMIYRYIIVFLKEVERVTDAYSLRAPNERGINIKVWGTLVGQTLLRSIDRAEMVYSSMQTRGYQGEYYFKMKKSARIEDYLFCLVWIVVLTIIRVY